MSGDETYPATVGQLSVWREIERLPADRLWEANLSSVWDLPEGDWSEERIWSALGAAAMRHASMRTVYVLDEDGFPRQRVAAHSVQEVLAQVGQGTADVAEREAKDAAELQRAIDTTAELPWRAWILLDGGTPKQVLVVFNHMAADGVGGLVLREDFETILGGTELPPAPGPIELALDQQGEGSGRLRNAERYWRRTISAAPHRPAGGDAEPLGAVLHTGIPMPLANEAIGKFEVTLASLILAAYYRGIQAATGEDAVLLLLMSSNRFDETHARVVTSLNQWTPLLLRFEPDEPFEEILPKVHWKAFNALKNGVCSPDAMWVIRDEHERLDPPVDPGFSYNPMLAPPGFPSEDRLVAPRIERFEPARATGPGFYLIVRGLTSLDLVFRTRRHGFDDAAMTTMLHTIQDRLAGTIGGERL
ncbi:condensation domain-containing protein [Dactylosporangium sp. NPDC005555]|uniref:condensation domain-containing protein n=1 Tax=Dactylosporangium sp. NPDC005555 TaxID=3154889 RepID=UPI0033AD5BF4